MAMETEEGKLVRGSLAQGNRGAQEYFIKRIDLMLQDFRDDEAPAQLHRFMKKWWPDFKAGLRHHGQTPWEE